MPDKNLFLRLRKKHTPADTAEVAAEDGALLVRAQSLRSAVVASLIGIVAFAVLWVMITRLTGRVFPWMTILLGYLVGYAIRRTGRGVDWRFPMLASVMAFLGAFASNIVVAASNTAAGLGTTTLEVLWSVTLMTWPVYFREVTTPADYVYAFAAAILAAFLANRRLSRAEYRALRRFREKS